MAHTTDFRPAIRRLLKSRGATLVSVLALACGVGAATATWSLLSAVLLHPLAVEEPNRLFVVTSTLTPSSGRAFVSEGFVYPAYQEIRDSGAFRGLAAGGPQILLVTEQGAIPQTRTVYFASHDFFSTLGVRLARGTGFFPEDDRRGAAPKAVLSDRYWRTIFSGDQDVLGKTLLVGRTPVTIVGIAPRAFRGLHLAEAPDLSAST